MRTTQNAMTATATAGMMTSSSRRERTRQFFSSRRDPLCLAGVALGERWWLAADGPGTALVPDGR